MTRLGNMLCKLNHHDFAAPDPDDFGRVWCARCGTRKPKVFAQIQTEEQRGRELNRPKTKGQR
jgi:hypothetical protein